MLSELRHDLTVALRAHDRVAVAALRSAIAAIENAQAVPVQPDTARETSSQHIAGATPGAGSTDVARRVLSEAEMRAVVRQQIEERLNAAEEYEQLGRVDAAGRLRQEAAVLLRIRADG